MSGDARDDAGRLLAVLAAARRGDFTARCGSLPGPLAPVAEALDELLVALARDLAPLHAQVSEVSAASEQLQLAVKLLAASAARQATAVSDIARKLQSLGARSEEVGQIVELLDDVAAETNILALNAAIEASRAGAQGKGFGMVADEVRKLAERSAAATKDIAAFVQAIEGTASESVRVVEAVRGVSEEIAGAGNDTSQAAAQIAGAAHRALQALSRFRLPAHEEADLYAALGQRRSELERALAGLAPLVENPQVARTPVGDALRRLIAALATLQGPGGSRTEPHAG
jgi:methyl-accepting chemotaxis protein